MIVYYHSSATDQTKIYTKIEALIDNNMEFRLTIIFNVNNWQSK